ncbi:MAG: hypothetical protein M3384_05120 [Acidobacteriota bacterium]|nr:hypothetical protein [Acidobacteriota bacterium]
MKAVCGFVLFFAALSTAGGAFAQTVESGGVGLYNRGDFQGAIALLKNADEAEGIFYLGLAYEKTGDAGRAKDAFKKAFAKSYDVFFRKFDEWNKTAAAAPAAAAPARKSLSELLREVKANNQIGFSAAEKAYALKSDIFQTSEWRIKAKVLSDTLALAKTPGEIYAVTDKSLSGAGISERPFIPSPKDNKGIPYGRVNQSPNKPILVTIFTVFGADGKIKLKLPLENIYDAFTVQVLNGIEAVKFRTATKDGQPVAYYTRFHYSYSFG